MQKLSRNVYLLPLGQFPSGLVHWLESTVDTHWLESAAIVR